MENIIILLVTSILVESIWETLKMTWQNGKLSIDRIGALVVGIVMALITKLDILDVLGIKCVIPIVGYILTGVLISRGANFMHDLIRKVGLEKKVK